MDINLGISGGLQETLQRFLIMLSTSKALMVIGLSIFTFKFLDLFLETNIKIAKKEPIQRGKMKQLVTSLLLIFITIVPIVIVTVRMFEGDFRLDSIGVLLIISVLGAFILSFILKMMLPKGDERKKRGILLVEAFHICIEVLAENLAFWIQGAVIGIINLILDIVRAPFVSYYLIVGTVINLGLSFALTGFMGSSAGAGEVNIIGSLIGGTAHAILRRKKIESMRIEMESKRKQTSEETNEA
jgi:heme/copper-type cytochrome/quinol oxidase subunit 4